MIGAILFLTSLRIPAALHDAFGLILLAGAVVLQVAGAVLMRQMIKVEV